MLDKLQIIKKLKELQLPADQYIVFSGGSLALHGIRETGDIDIGVTPELFKNLEKNGEWEYSTKYGGKTEFLSKGSIDIASRLGWKEHSTTLSQAKEREDIIEGIPFMSLEDVIQFKQAYGRPKDFADIALIKAYLEVGR